jgi:hypothetical protein
VSYKAFRNDGLFSLVSNEHQANATIAELGCGNIGKIVLRNPTHCARVIDCQGHQVILQAMKIHIKDENVQVYMMDVSKSPKV